MQLASSTREVLANELHDQSFFNAGNIGGAENAFHCNTLNVHQNYQTAMMQEAPMKNGAHKEPILAFSFGLLEEQGRPEIEDSEVPLRGVSPTITAAQRDSIRRLGTRIRKIYQDLLDSSAKMRRPRVIELKKRVADQKRSLERHIQEIEKWVKSPSQPIAKRASDDARGQKARASRIVEELVRTLKAIQGTLEEALVNVPKIITWYQTSNTNRRQLAKSPPFLAIKANIERVQEQVTSFERQVLEQAPGCLPLESTRGFRQLDIASRATRMLYRCLCNACPRADHDQNHRHCALVGLVPASENLFLADEGPDAVASISHGQDCHPAAKPE